MIADLSLFDLFAAVIAHDECVKCLLMGLEGVLAPIHRATLPALVDLVGVTLSLVEPGAQINICQKAYHFLGSLSRMLEFSKHC